LFILAIALVNVQYVLFNQKTLYLKIILNLVSARSNMFHNIFRHVSVKLKPVEMLTNKITTGNINW
jgi:hypothetical protein